MSAPGVFLSSTCYDLGQARADLVAFLEGELGYSALASEYSSFPVDPDVDTVENCRRRLERADCLVLLIGVRYGSVPPGSDKSVTNLEYEFARAKGIPVFAFVMRGVLAVVPAWEANPDADFSRVVESSAVFRFIQQVRSADGVWTFAFERVQDVISTLRIQLAYQMKRGLDLQRQISIADEDISDLRAGALRLAIEKPDGWPVLLAAELIRVEIAARELLRRASTSETALGLGTLVAAPAELSAWFQLRSAEVIRVNQALKVILEGELTTAFGGHRVLPIRTAVGRLAEAYTECLEWSARVRRSQLPSEFAECQAKFARIVRDLTDMIEGFPAQFEAAVGAASKLPVTERRLTLNLTLTVRDMDGTTDAFNEALATWQRNLR